MKRTIIAGRSFTLNRDAVSSRRDTSNANNSSVNNDNSETDKLGEHLNYDFLIDLLVIIQ